MYGYICEGCGARLDPGEKCDCGIKKERPGKGRIGEKIYINYTKEKSEMQVDFKGRDRSVPNM